MRSWAAAASSRATSEHGNFEVAAWVRLPDGRSLLQHYWHDNSDVSLPWRNGQVISRLTEELGQWKILTVSL